MQSESTICRDFIYIYVLGLFWGGFFGAGTILWLRKYCELLSAG